MIDAVHARFFAGEADVSAAGAARRRAGRRRPCSVRPTRIWSPSFSAYAVVDARAVDVGAVGAAQVAEDPVAVVGGSSSAVPAADGVVGDGKLPAVAANQRGASGSSNRRPLSGPCRTSRVST